MLSSKKLNSFLVNFRNLSSKYAEGKPFETIPGPRALPLIGNLWRYLPIIGDYKPNTLFENAKFNKNRYGPIVREKLTNKHTILHLFDPNDIETFARQDGKFPHRRSHRALLKYRLDRPHDYLDGGLFAENGPNWYRQRRQLQRRLFSKSQIAANIFKLDEISVSMVKQIRSEQRNHGTDKVANFDSFLYKWALRNSMAMFLDLDIRQFDEQLVDKFIQELHDTLDAIDVTEIQTDRWQKNPNRCPHYRKLVSSQDFLYKFVAKQVNNCSNDGSGNPVSFLRDWLYADAIDRRDVTAFIIDALLAGLHTTSYTFAFLLYYISKGDTQSLVRAELESNLPKEGSLTIEHVDSLHLLRNCLKETMRLSPVSIGTGRLTTQDNLIIRDYNVPKGTMIITQNQVISRDKTIYTDPNEFKPERWAAYRAIPREHRPPPFATLPFGFGARLCIGQRLAELQIKIMALRLLQHFHVTFDRRIPVKTTLIHNIDGHFSVSLTSPR